MAHLFTPFSCKNLHIKNRIVMPPMCQYSVTAKDGLPNDWHFVHYVSRAVGGTGLVMMEMTAIEPDGRITDYDLGLWSDEHVPAFARMIESCHRYDTKVGIQIGHAGRKAKDAAVPVAPSAIPFGPEYKTPRELTTDEVKRMVDKFRAAIRRAVRAGVDTVEIHGAHGYLVHQFHSPLTNRRSDEYGQDLTRFGAEVIQAAKSEIPGNMPLMMRISTVEYAEGGYGLEYSTKLCQTYKAAGCDMFDISSGGEGPIRSQTYLGPGYQVSMARAIKEAVQVPVIAAGKLEDPALAESVIGNGDADLVAVGRGMLKDPYWALHAAVSLACQPDPPKQYQRAY